MSEALGNERASKGYPRAASLQSDRSINSWKPKTTMSGS
jgi:hypothetical protein